VTPDTPPKLTAESPVPAADASAPGVPTEPSASGPVNTWNEWDPLEEIVVGIVEDALIPPWETITPAVVHDKTQWPFFQTEGGTRWPAEMLKKAEADIEAFVHTLEAEGVSVRRPERFAWDQPVAAPGWSLPSSCYALMPRDVLLVVGDQIIEAPMGWRSRFFEHHAYKRLCKEYWRGGARWISAPRPELSDASYEPDFVPMNEGEPQRTIATEYEPLFDAADAIKCGRDLFIAQSSCCNRFGIEWLRRHLAPQVTVHEVEVYDTHPMHIDATFYPLAPGKLLVHPERCAEVPDMFAEAGWDILTCPEPDMPLDHPMYNCSRWISMNAVMLDERRVIVSKGEERLISAFKRWGFTPIECPFYDFETIGGGFHCASVDIRRRGTLQSYF
jgi:glycine amidinotransferase